MKALTHHCKIDKFEFTVYPCVGTSGEFRWLKITGPEGLVLQVLIDSKETLDLIQLLLKSLDDSEASDSQRFKNSMDKFFNFLKKKSELPLT